MKERLTHERKSGIQSGYWSPNKKQELVDRLAEYENAAEEREIVSGEEFETYLSDIRVMVDNWKKEGLSYLSRRCQLMDIICGINDTKTAFTVKQFQQLLDTVK